MIAFIQCIRNIFEGQEGYIANISRIWIEADCLIFSRWFNISGQAGHLLLANVPIQTKPVFTVYSGNQVVQFSNLFRHKLKFPVSLTGWLLIVEL